MNRYTAAVLGGGFFWGFMGFFTRHLALIGIDSNGAIVVRCGIAALCFAALILCTNPSQFKVRLRDVWCFIGTGLFSLLFFTFCYFHAISMMNLSTAAILLYTAPTFVMLMSAVLFGEKITGSKIAAVILSFAGCALVSGVGTGTALTPAGLMYGLGAGFGYALYTIFSRYALQRGYSTSTINFYSCLLAAAGACVIWRPQGIASAMTSSVPAFLWCLGCGVLSCFVPYLLYTYGLTGMENGKASILASVEPVVASIIGVFIYHEKMTLLSAAGVVLVLAAILLLNLKHMDTGTKRERTRNDGRHSRQTIGAD